MSDVTLGSVDFVKLVVSECQAWKNKVLTATNMSDEEFESNFLSTDQIQLLAEKMWANRFDPDYQDFERVLGEFINQKIGKIK